MSHRLAALLAVALAVGCGGDSAAGGEVTVASKPFTESVILAELAVLLGRSEGVEITHRRQLGGTRVLWNALGRGDIDLYPEYTGTLLQEIFRGEVPRRGLADALAERGLRMGRPLGFDNTYALGMLESRAAELGIERIGDLADHPELSLAFSNEFMDRGDGWPGLAETYGLPHDAQGLQHDLAYRGLESGDIDVMDLYSTDGEILYYDLRVLEDDRGYFPEYEAVFLWRAELEERAPQLIQALRRLEGTLDEERMSTMNARAKIDREPEGEVAAELLAEELGVDAEVRTSAMADRIARRTGEHLYLVGISMAAAILLAVPLGIAAARLRRAGQGILGVVGIIQTIPSLALLVFMIPLLGIGAMPAIFALFLYSLLPIVRNTYAGLHDIPGELEESAAALGLPAAARMRLIELPLAARSILAGIKTSVVINIGTATLGALIGAGGYGQPILTGIRLDDVGLILEGAVPAAGLALVAQGVFELVERLVVPRGLRLEAAR